MAPDGDTGAARAATAEAAADPRSFVGASAGTPVLSPDPVNLPMIRHWVEAMGDRDPVYLSDEAAVDAGFDRSFAPPSMLQAFIMRGLRATLDLEASRAAGQALDDSPMWRLTALLDAEGLTSVVATNCEQEYDRPLVVGDRLVTQAVIEDVSEVKKTALGTGRFVTTRTDFFAVPDHTVHPGDDPADVMARGERVATMRFRILKFRPQAKQGGASAGGGAGAAQPAAERPPRPRPAITQDNAFFFEGTRQGKLLIQRCTNCGTLRHPPLPACGTCRSFQWDTLEASGRGELYSWVVVHHPQVPSFDYPLTIGLVALNEGTRLVADLVGVAPHDLAVGLPLELTFVTLDDELTLPMFRPRADGAAAAHGAAVAHGAAAADGAA